MAFADPQTVTINAIANTLARVPSAPNQGLFAKDDGLVSLAVYQNIGKRYRQTITLNHAKVAADPLLAGVNVKAGMTVTMTVNSPETGYTIAEKKQIVDALVAYLSASSGARVTQLLGREG